MEQPDLFGDGRPARDKGMQLAAAAANRQTILARARAIAVSIASRRPARTVNADDVYRVLIREGYDVEKLGNAAGSIFRGPMWEFTNQRKQSVRISNHARQIMIWRLK